MRVIVAYDIENDKRRARAHDILLGYMWPVQKSLFEGELSQPLYDGLLAELRPLRAGGDRIRLYRLCRGCAQRVIDVGAKLEAPWESTYVA